jgi:hypothetical protein
MAKAQGHAEVHPLRVAASSAQEAVGGKIVVLSLKLENGLPVAFSLQPTEAEELHKQLGEAVTKAKQQGAAERH